RRPIHAGAHNETRSSIAEGGGTAKWAAAGKDVSRTITRAAPRATTGDKEQRTGRPNIADATAHRRQRVEGVGPRDATTRGCGTRRASPCARRPGKLPLNPNARGGPPLIIATSLPPSDEVVCVEAAGRAPLTGKRRRGVRDVWVGHRTPDVTADITA